MQIYITTKKSVYNGEIKIYRRFTCVQYLFDSIFTFGTLWFTKELSKYKIYSGSFSKYGTDFKKTVKEGELTYEHI